jgi:putative ABC transport system permease protein
MGLAAILARQSLLQRPGRTLFSILGIAVGIATVVGIFTLDHNTLILRAHSDDPDWQAEIQVSPSQAVKNPREELQHVVGVTDVSAVFQSQASLWLDGGEPRGAYFIGLEPARARELGKYTLLAGRDLEAGRAELLVGENLANELGLAPGSRIGVSPPRVVPAEECVGGELVQRELVAAQPPIVGFEVVGILARDGIGRRASGQVVVADVAVAEPMFSDGRVQKRFWVRRDPKVNLETLQANLGEAWSYDLKRSVIIGQAADERAFRNGVRFAGLLALVLGLYVIFHTLSMSVVERVREVGVLHALGTSRAQIARVFFTEAVLVSGAGGVFGLAGGVGLAWFLLRKQVTTVGIGVGIPRHKMAELFEVPWDVVGPLVIAGVAIALVGSIYPLVRARDTDAVAALRGEDTRARHSRGARSFQWLSAALLALVMPAIYFFVVPVIGEGEGELVKVILLGLGVLSLFIAVPLVAPALLAFVCARLARPFEARWPLVGQLAARTMQQGPARIAGGVAGLALVTAGYVGLHGMTRSLEAEIDLWSSEAFRDRVYVREMPPRPFEELAAALHAHPEVLGVEPNVARHYEPFLVVGVRESELAAYGPCAEDPRLIGALREQRGIILSRRLAKHRDYQVGDMVHMEAPGGRVESFPVVAISDAYGYFPDPDERLYGVVSDRWMKEHFCLETEAVGNFSVRFKSGVDPDAAEALVRSTLALPERGVTVKTGEYLYGWHSTDIARDFLLFDIILALTLALAGLGVLNGQLLSALERGKELGVLKALGMSRAQVAGSVILESLVVGVVGGGLGAALGAAVIPVIVQALTVISGLPLPPVGPGVFLPLGWAGAIVVAVLAGLYPIWRMNRNDAIAAVRLGG